MRNKFSPIDFPFLGGSDEIHESLQHALWSPHFSGVVLFGLKAFYFAS